MISYEIILILTWSANCVICKAKRTLTLAINDTKLYVPVVTWSTQGNTKLVQELKSGFKFTNWNKYQSKVSTQAPNQYLDCQIDPSFQGVNRLFVLSFEDITSITGHNIFFQK